MYIVRVPDWSVHDRLTRMEGPHSSAVESVIEVRDLPLSTVLICEGRSQSKRKSYGLPNDRFVIIGLGKMLAPTVNLLGGGFDGRAVNPRAFAEGQRPVSTIVGVGFGIANGNISIGNEQIDRFLQFRIALGMTGLTTGSVFVLGVAFLIVLNERLAEVTESVRGGHLDRRRELKRIMLLDSLDKYGWSNALLDALSGAMSM